MFFQFVKKLLALLPIYKTCPQCGGTGFYQSEVIARYHEIDPIKDVCSICQGKGKIKIN